MNQTLRTLATALLIGAAAYTGAAVVGTGAVAATIRTPAVAKLMKEAQAAAHARNWRVALEKAQQAERAGPKGGEGIVVTQFIAYAATNAGSYSVALNAYDKLIAAGAVNRTEGSRPRCASRSVPTRRSAPCNTPISSAAPIRRWWPNCITSRGAIAT